MKSATQPVLEPVVEASLVRKPDDALAERPEASVSMFERLARDPSVDVDKLERLMQLHERAQARVSEEQFNAAMSAAQTAMRPIATDADNKQTNSRYASYAALDRVLRPIYTEHGFGISFDTAETATADTVRVLCYVTHKAGYKRTYRVDMPADGKGAKGGDAMTRTHAAGAAMSYGMRYLLKMIFNVAVGEDDKDGNAARKDAPDPPAGFQDWWDDMKQCAETDGEAALKTAWTKSRADFRTYLTSFHLDKWDALKAKSRAAKVQA